MRQKGEETFTVPIPSTSVHIGCVRGSYRGRERGWSGPAPSPTSSRPFGPGTTPTTLDTLSVSERDVSIVRAGGLTPVVCGGHAGPPTPPVHPVVTLCVRTYPVGPVRHHGRARYTGWAVQAYTKGGI